MKNKVQWALCVFHAWAEHRNATNTGEIVPPDPFDIELPELKKNLCRFILEARNSKGEKYPREMLYELLMCIQTHFHMHRFHLKFLDDAKFAQVKNTLDNATFSLHLQE